MREQIEACIEKLRAGELKEDDLRALAARPAAGPRQSLLYLQLQNTHPGSQALGYAMIVGGKTIPAPRDPKDWPYASALDAVRDGWRIISFPNLALLMDPVTPQALGCEFILEKWS